MSNIRVNRVVRFWLAILVATLCCAQFAFGQTPAANTQSNGLLPLLGTQPPNGMATPALYQQPASSPRPATMARLIENPDQTDGAPPFALTDQSGTVQRYVEPVPGINLASYVGQVVGVRHDTGTTLLASQLELPPQPLNPLANTSVNDRLAMNDSAALSWRRTAEPDDAIEQVQFIDNDDTSVELLPEDVSISNPDGMPAGTLRPLSGMPPSGDFPAFSGPMGPGMEWGGPPMGPMPYGPGPMPYGPGPMPYPNQMMAPCPNCGGYHGRMGFGPGGDCGYGGEPDRARLTADVELLLLRPNIAESSIGKLSEEMQFSPRFVLGLQGAGNLDGRVRYWHYNKASDFLDDDGDIKIRFDVLDIEAIHRFEGRKSEITLAAGLRLARIKLTDINDEKCGADFIGLTMAADGLTPLGRFPQGHFGLVYGGRLSILGGDWGGDDNCLFINEQSRDDNLLSHELYAGVELARRFRMLNVRARLLFEMQNWRSDVLADDAEIESIGFMGPGFQLGADF
jgi:hypothetical protein